MTEMTDEEIQRELEKIRFDLKEYRKSYEGHSKEDLITQIIVLERLLGIIPDECLSRFCKHTCRVKDCVNNGDQYDCFHYCEEWL